MAINSVGDNKLSSRAIYLLKDDFSKHPYRYILTFLFSLMISFLISVFSGKIYQSALHVEIGSCDRQELESIDQLESFIRENYKKENVGIEFVKNLGKNNLIKIKLKSKSSDLPISAAKQIQELIEERHRQISSVCTEDLVQMDNLYKNQKEMLENAMVLIKSDDGWKNKRDLSSQILYFISNYNLVDIYKRIKENKKSLLSLQEESKTKIVVEQEKESSQLPAIPIMLGLILASISFFLFVNNFRKSLTIIS